MPAPQDAWAAPLAKQLVDAFRVPSLTLVRTTTGAYDPTTGVLTTTETRITSAGAVVRSGLSEAEGTGETRELIVWIDHTSVPGPVGKDDQLEYQGRRWRIVDVSPTYSGDVLYASKLTARSA